ncbi:hypothetical protein P280DRAFT_544974 [Massarina eburnea CBS 473.64]|uniref:Uncharacterized protein n=1 Tax=Massarina eburnea CBS 473.64 TaxID=1395130 RepID=A0A6A6SGI5_9PLEO|nr:hypothetical protein P280DRAFT_544974 [Massarina eburnea CBS 473.64]
MALRHLSTAPKTADFTPLQEHQEQTPSTFFGAKPVLYAHYSGLALSASPEKLAEDATFSAFKTEHDAESGDALIKDVEIWVNSENLILFQSTPTPTGVNIPYPSIALHATLKYKGTTDALLLNLSLNDANNVNDADDINILELTILPPGHTTASPQSACIPDIFAAMNTCADLHPDPDEGGEENGVFDETAPGATGWITADNMGDFEDAEGNLNVTVIGGEELGPGAGTVRARDDGTETNGMTDADDEGHGEKYQRTG